MNRNIASIIANADDLATELGHTPEAFSAALFKYAFDHARVHRIHMDGDPIAIAAKIAVEPVGTMGPGVGQFQQEKDTPHGADCPCYSCRIRFARRSAFGAQQNRIYGGECDV